MEGKKRRKKRKEMCPAGFKPKTLAHANRHESQQPNQHNNSMKLKTSMFSKGCLRNSFKEYVSLLHQRT